MLVWLLSVLMLPAWTGATEAPRQAERAATTVAAAPSAASTAATTAPASLASEVSRLSAQVAALEEMLKAQDELAVASEKETSRLRITSWLDLDFDHETRPGGRGTFDNEHAYFIFNGRVSPEWTAYSELEFEHGAELAGGGGGSGNILIEQAWMDYRRSPYANLRLGKFLTPYGVWNRNHWDPITETSTGPFLFRQRLVPVSETGLQFYGGVQRGRFETNYVVYVTNGRGTRPHSADDNGDKAAGFDLSTGPERKWQVGLSGYVGEDGTDGNRSEELGVLWGTWQHGPWHAQSEWLRRWGGRERDAFYVQPSYRIDEKWKAVLRYDTWNPDLTSGQALRQTEVLAGVNRRFAESVLLKLEVIRHADAAAGGPNYNRYVSSLSMLF